MQEHHHCRKNGYDTTGIEVGFQTRYCWISVEVLDHFAEKKRLEEECWDLEDRMVKMWSEANQREIEKEKEKVRRRRRSHER